MENLIVLDIQENLQLIKKKLLNKEKIELLQFGILIVHLTLNMIGIQN